MDASKQEQRTSSHTEVESMSMDPRIDQSVELYYAHALTPLRLAKAPLRGRHLLAASDLPQGYEVWSGAPYAAITSATQLRTHCAYCFVQPVQSQLLLRCSSCKILRYCSSACQVSKTTTDQGGGEGGGGEGGGEKEGNTFHMGSERIGLFTRKSVE